MAFNDVVFPEIKLVHGVRKDIIDPIAVVGNGTREFRLKKNKWEKFVWSIPGQTMTEAKFKEIRKFLAERNHGLNSFKYVDPDFPAFADTPLVNATTVSSDALNPEWVISTPLDSSTGGTHHPLFAMKYTDFTVKVNGVPDVTTSQRITADGYPVLWIPGSLPSDVVTVSGTCYHTVRLESVPTYTLAALDENNLPIGHIIGEIKLTEVFES